MTEKQAIDWCEQFTDNLVMVNVDTKKRTLGLQAMQICKSALSKQIPKKVEVINKNYGYYSCRICGSTITYRVHKYCCRCGQKLDWGDGE